MNVMEMQVLMESQPVLAPSGSAEFNARLWAELKDLAADVADAMGDDLVALVLGGGYGRAEGCVVEQQGVESAYNDVDLFLVTRTLRPQGREQLARIAHRYERRLRIAVDFSRPMTVSMIRKWPALLMWQELALGHQVLCGPTDVLTANVPNRVLQPLPVVEASRQLLNRGAGLLWAARVARGLEPRPDDTFVVRNYFKCAQSIADAVLIGCGRYASEPAVKLARLTELSKTESIVDESGALVHLRRAYEFRRSPHATYTLTRQQLTEMAQDWERVFLWVESLRLKPSFRNLKHYASWRGRREMPSTSLLERIAANLRQRRLGWSHPREKVYPTLALAMGDLAGARRNFIFTSYRAMTVWKEAQ